MSCEILIDWLANHNPPWAAYLTLVSGQVIAPDKHPGVFLVEVGETWRHIFHKCVLRIMVTKVDNDFKDEQLCSGFKEAINGAVHGVKSLWDDNLSTYNWVFLLVDSNNAFNEINQIGRVLRVRAPAVHFWKSWVESCSCYSLLEEFGGIVLPPFTFGRVLIIRAPAIHFW